MTTGTTAHLLPPPARSIRVRSTFVGYHRWPGATGDRDYLAARHRHEFTVTAELGVTHEDREVEFHDVAEYLTGLPARTYTVRSHHGAISYELGGASCEMVGEAIASGLEARWPGRLLWVEVAEDLQSTARLTYRSELAS